MMDGLIVLHTRATRVLFSESYTPNFGLPMEDGEAIQDSTTVGATLAVLHMNAEALGHEGDGSGVKLFETERQRLHFNHDTSCGILVVVLTQATISCSVGLHLVDLISSQFASTFGEELRRKGLPGASNKPYKAFSSQLFTIYQELPQWLCSQIAQSVCASERVDQGCEWVYLLSGKSLSSMLDGPSTVGSPGSAAETDSALEGSDERPFGSAVRVVPDYPEVNDQATLLGCGKSCVEDHLVLGDHPSVLVQSEEQAYALQPAGTKHTLQQPVASKTAKAKPVPFRLPKRSWFSRMCGSSKAQGVGTVGDLCAELALEDNVLQLLFSSQSSATVTGGGASEKSSSQSDPASSSSTRKTAALCDYLFPVIMDAGRLMASLSALNFKTKPTGLQASGASPVKAAPDDSPFESDGMMISPTPKLDADGPHSFLDDTPYAVADALASMELHVTPEHGELYKIVVLRRENVCMAYPTGSMDIPLAIVLASVEDEMATLHLWEGFLTSRAEAIRRKNEKKARKQAN